MALWLKNDILIKDRLVIVTEIKSSISKAEVAAFLRKTQLYEKKEGRKIDKNCSSHLWLTARQLSLPFQVI